MAKMSTMSQAIAKEVAKLLLPRMKKIVEESVERKMKDLVYDSVVNGKKKPISEADDWDDEPKNGHSVESTNEAKKAIAERSKNRAREIGEKFFSKDEMDLIMDTEVPDLNPSSVSESVMKSAGSVKASELSKHDNVDPEMIDYSEMLADL